MTEKIVSNLIDSNVFVVSKNDKCLIFDAGACVQAVKDVVANRKVLAVFLTHGHYDHAYHALDYSNEFDCKIYCSEHAKEYLENPNINYSEGEFKVVEFENFEFLSGEGCLILGDFSIKFKQLGGHSKSDMCFKVDDEIFVGDVLIGRDMGRIDLYGGDKQEMLKSLKSLLETNYKIMHSGHGSDNEKSEQDKVINLWQRFLNR